MSTSPTRRDFISSAVAVAAVGAASASVTRAAPAPRLPGTGLTPSTTPASTLPKKLNVGIVGVGGQGMWNLKQVREVPSANIVALCDVDAVTLVNAARLVTDAKVFTAFRDMLAMPGLDAVLVATPDHMHAPACAAALRAGKHVYCEKPLTHTIAEGRALVALAEESGLVTQLGIQNHATDNYRRVVETIQAGAIGPVREVHVWHARTRRPHSEELAPPPAQLNYDLWLGPQAVRPFKKGFHPYSWRHWWAFGAGQLGDQSCHFLDVVMWSLDLKHPTRVSARGDAPPSDEMANNHIVAEWQFPARGEQPPVTLHWYDNPEKPAEWSKWNVPKELADEAVMFVGDKGMLCTHYNKHVLLPEENFKDYTPPAPTIAKSPGHHREWVDACLKKDPTAAKAPFRYAAPLTELSILGLIAYRIGKPLEWDAANLRFPNAPEAEALLSYRYRDGWTL